MTFDFPTLLSGPLVGGMAIGLAGALLLLLNGRILGVSGIVGTLLTLSTNSTARAHAPNEFRWRLAFLVGLFVGGGLLAFTSDTFTTAVPVVSHPLLLVLAGLLVGVGTRLGLGCTSGHGICGLARLSGRSLLATALFMGAGMLVVAVLNATGLFGKGFLS
ncbi:MAG: YeeE/YedE family protein [Silvanigrellales bacterium]|nr:YeeE/YedE family protein [Silvanigrellales bacterium]